MSVPSIETLGPETLVPGWTAKEEWAPFTEEELAVAGKMKLWLGEAAFSVLAYDRIIVFIRGYAYRADWQRAAFAFLARGCEWREGYGTDSILEGEGTSGFDAFTSPHLAQFDRLVASSIIGTDMHGHMVELNRIFGVSVKELMNTFTDEQFLRQMVARREVLRGLSNVNARTQGKKIYKCVSIIDASGLSLAHLRSKDFHARMRAFNELFSWFYPETTHKLVVINAPRIFTACWAIAKHFVHPITASKVTIVGHTYTKTFKELGIVLSPGIEVDSHGKLPKSVPTYRDLLAKIKAEHPLELVTKGWVPKDDAEGLAAC